jgi:peptidoglycan hydrolase-like protein with peptidoglycan-binding domain
MSLQSQLFRGDPKLEAAAISDPAHIVPGASGPHVGKIQQALMQLGQLTIEAGELQGTRYGPSTASAVLAYKRQRNIVNHGYQTQADNIVGKMTIAALDKELVGKQGTLDKKLRLCGREETANVNPFTFPGR